MFGAGMQGMTIANNLAERADTAEVIICDINDTPRKLRKKCTFMKVDALRADQVHAATRGVSAAILALPGHIAFAGLGHLIAAKIPIVDISFGPDAPRGSAYDTSARAAGIPVLIDVGVAPGLSQILGAALRRELNGLRSLRVYCGGLPLEAPPVFRHAVFFNARDLLAQYVRPARMRENGREEARSPLLSTVEQLHDYDVGPLEAFLSDGLRSLLQAYPDIPEMYEMTLRLPGHLETMRILHTLGILDSEAAISAAAEAIEERFPASRFRDRVLVEVWGSNGVEEKRYRLHVQQQENITAMSRATGCTAAASAVFLARGMFNKPGVHTPERLGEDAVFTTALFEDLNERGVQLTTHSKLRHVMKD